MQTQGFTNKGHMEGGICRFMSTDTRTKRLRERHPRTGIQRFQDTLTVDHESSGICKTWGCRKIGTHRYWNTHRGS